MHWHQSLDSDKRPAGRVTEVTDVTAGATPPSRRNDEAPILKPTDGMPVEGAA